MNQFIILNADSKSSFMKLAEPRFQENLFNVKYKE